MSRPPSATGPTSLPGSPALEDTLFRRLGDANLVGVGFGDELGRISYVNDEMLRMMGHSRAALESGAISWKDVIAPEYREAARAVGERLLVDGIARGYELAFARPDGGRTRYLGAAALVHPEDGFHVSVAIDVTRERELEQALRQADQRKNHALAVVTHEIRGPLSVLATGLDVLERLGREGKTVPLPTVEIMRRQVAQITRITADLVDATRMSRGALSISRTVLDLRQVAERVGEEVREDFARAGIQFGCRVDDGPVLVLGDAGRLAQVITNLLQNAIKFSSRGSSVSLAIHAAEEATITVRDQGKGISRDVLDRVLEPFDRGTETESSGLGLGLAIVDAIVALHEGTLRVESEGPGRGTMVVVGLPLA